MDDLEKNEILGDLYAYYGGLLTKSQQSYFEDYYYNDLSLGEIASNHHEAAINLAANIISKI